MIPQNKNVRQLILHFQYVDTSVEGSGLYCYNKECDKDSVVSHASSRMDVSRTEQRAYSGLWTLWGTTLKANQFSEHVLNEGHEMKTMEETMSIIHLENKQRKINTLVSVEATSISWLGQLTVGV